MRRIVAASLLFTPAAGEGVGTRSSSTPSSAGATRSAYRGTRLAAPSETGLARVLVASPP